MLGTCWALIDLTPMLGLFCSIFTLYRLRQSLYFRPVLGKGFMHLYAFLCCFVVRDLGFPSAHLRQAQTAVFFHVLGPRNSMQFLQNCAKFPVAEMANCPTWLPRMPTAWAHPRNLDRPTSEHSSNINATCYEGQQKEQTCNVLHVLPK